MRGDLHARMGGRDASRDDTDDDGCDDRDGEHREHASRQVLQHHAFGTVVVVGMRRAAGNRRRVDMVMAGVVVARGMRMKRDAIDMRAEVVEEKRERTERRPGERDQRAPGDARLPTPGTRGWPCPASAWGHRRSVNPDCDRPSIPRCAAGRPRRLPEAAADQQLSGPFVAGQSSGLAPTSLPLANGPS